MVPNGFYWVAPADLKSIDGLILLVHLEDGTIVAM
jgi:hypothetical protein